MSEHALSSERLAPLHELSDRRETAAAKALADAQRVLAEREAQLRDLESYREPQLVGAQAAVQNTALLSNLELFRKRLSEAIQQQRRVVAEAGARVEAARAHWVAQRTQKRVVDQLIERSKAAERRVSNRREQKEFDELALRLRMAALRGAES